MVNNDKLQVLEKIIRDKKASDAHIVLRKKKTFIDTNELRCYDEVNFKTYSVMRKMPMTEPATCW